MKVTEELFNDWLQHPVTEAYAKLLQEEVMARREMVGAGVCTIDQGSFEEIGQRYSAHMEAIKAYETILNGMTYENLFPKIEEESEDGSESEEDGR